MNQKRRIELHIEELVIDGLSSQDKNRITSVISQELHRLFSKGDISRKMTRNIDIPRMDGDTIRLKPNETVRSKGIKIARSLYRGLQK